MAKWIVLLLATVALCGCDDGGSSAIVVHPGESIQAAVDSAPSGAAIFVEPGIYRESAASADAVTITRDDVQIIAQSTADSPVVLENAGGQQNGFVVAPGDSTGSPRRKVRASIRPAARTAA